MNLNAKMIMDTYYSWIVQLRGESKAIYEEMGILYLMMFVRDFQPKRLPKYI